MTVYGQKAWTMEGQSVIDTSSKTVVVFTSKLIERFFKLVPRLKQKVTNFPFLKHGGGFSIQAQDSFFSFFLCESCLNLDVGYQRMFLLIRSI